MSESATPGSGDVDLSITQLDEEDFWRWLVKKDGRDVAGGVAPTLAVARSKAELVAQRIIEGKR